MADGHTMEGKMNKVGIMIMSGFAALWFVWGLSAISPIKGVWLLLPFAVSGAMMACAMRLPIVASEADRRRVGRIVGWASGIEGVAIFTAVKVLTYLRHPGYVMVATLAIVGLHFLPLAHFLRVPLYYATGAALVGLAVLGCLIGPETTRLLVVGTGAAVLLWLTCVASFSRRAARG
jgi:hypothetical protein